MWSVGGITAAALTGDVIFTNRDHPEFQANPGKVILGLSSKCNLDAIDQAKHWQKVGKRPKDFIKRLLVLDESERLTVEQALTHPWFSNTLHATDLEAIYHQAIAQWVPNRKHFKMIECLDAKSRFANDASKLPRSTLSTDSISYFFQPPGVLNQSKATSSNPSVPTKRIPSPLPPIAEEAHEPDDFGQDSHARPSETTEALLVKTKSHLAVPGLAVENEQRVRVPQGVVHEANICEDGSREGIVKRKRSYSNFVESGESSH
jgi:pheromone a factor receptor